MRQRTLTTTQMAAKILRAIAVYPEDAGMAKGYPNKLLEDRISGVEKNLRSLGAVTARATAAQALTEGAL